MKIIYWNKFKKSCYILNIISSLILIIPYFIKKNNRELYFGTAFFSYLLHHDLCNDGNLNIYLQIIELIFIINLIIKNKKNIYIAFISNKYNYLNILILILAIYFYIKGAIGFRNNKPYDYHFYHTIWHILMGILMILN